MGSSRHAKAARWILGGLVALAAIWLACVDYQRKVSTDVLDLIPSEERSPELSTLRQLANERFGRIVLLVLRRPEQVADDAWQRAADAWTKSLARSEAFAETARLGDQGPGRAAAAYLFQHRLELLWPSQVASWKREYDQVKTSEDFAHWAADKAAKRLNAFLGKPEAVAFQDLMPADPLLLMPQLSERLQSFAGLAGSERPRIVLVWALSKGSPFKDEGQAPVFAAVAAAESVAKAALPGVEMKWTGVARFADESKRRIQNEMSSLNLASLLAVLAIGVASMRRPQQALYLAPVLGASLLGAWAVVTLVFSRVHVLVFVIGSLLGGVAIDYGFYLFLQPLRTPEESADEKVVRLRKPLLASVITTVIGFSFLLFSELPLIRQLGVFVSAGLVCALGAAWLWYLQVNQRWLESRPFLARRAEWAGRRSARIAVAVVAALTIAGGIGRLHWRDDIHELEIPAEALKKNDAEVRQLFGESGERTLYLTHGDSVASARDRLEAFGRWMGERKPGAGVGSIGAVLPTIADWQMVHVGQRELAGFSAALKEALTREGFDAGAFEPFFAALNECQSRGDAEGYEKAAAGLAAALRGPLGLMLQISPQNVWMISLAESAEGMEPPAELDTVSTGQLESLNRLFGRYRRSALGLSAAGLALVGASVFWLYGWRRGWRIFAVPSGACLAAFGVLGLSGQTLNLFHLLGAFLGVCLSHNYAIFSAENALRGDVPPPSIRLSGLTTTASFGVLAFSKIPVISALGTMVSLIVLMALVAVELTPFAESAADRKPRIHPE